MHAFSAHLASKIHWTTDREVATPADFGDSDAEYHALTTTAAWLDFSHMGCVALSGAERIPFFGGLVTNQVRQVSSNRSIYAAMLTPQGRYLWDFTLVDYPEQLLLVTEPDRVSALVQQITLYILRAKVQVADVGEQFSLLGVVGPTATTIVQQLFPTLDLKNTPLGATFAPAESLRLWRDPRHSEFGWRLLLPATQWAMMQECLCELLAPAGLTAWEAYRLQHGLPRGGNELSPGETLPLEAGLLEMNGVDFGKGCYIGQETTARTHHRGTIKKRLFQVRFTPGAVVPPGSPVLRADGSEVGSISSSASQNGAGLAILRSAAVANNEPLTAQKVAIIATRPAWATWDQDHSPTQVE